MALLPQDGWNLSMDVTASPLAFQREKQAILAHIDRAIESCHPMYRAMLQRKYTDVLNTLVDYHGEYTHLARILIKMEEARLDRQFNEGMAALTADGVIL